VYPLIGGIPRETDHSYEWLTGASIRMAHLQHEKTKHDWQGAQVVLFCFDELPHFTQTQFFYMFSRNRSVSGIRPYVRATTNPDADSWVKVLLAPWVDDEHPEFPFPPGQLRHFTQENGVIVWVSPDWRDENGEPGRTLTFIPASVFDNKELLRVDPGYLSNLRSLDHVEQRRLLYGDWKVRAEAGKVFNRDWFEIVPAAPAGGKLVRFWDFAATEKKQAGDDPDYTVGLRLKEVDDIWYIEDVARERQEPARIDEIAKNTASQDGRRVEIGWEIEPGASGKKVSRQLAAMFKGYVARGQYPTGDKVQRSKAAAAQAYAGNIKLVAGAWNSAFLAELHGFPDLPHDDQVDGLSGAFNRLTGMAKLDGSSAVANTAPSRWGIHTKEGNDDD